MIDWESLSALLLLIAFLVVLAIKEKPKNVDRKNNQKILPLQLPGLRQYTEGKPFFTLQNKLSPSILLIIYSTLIYFLGFISYFLLRGDLVNIYFHDEAWFTSMYLREYKHQRLTFFVSVYFPPIITISIWIVTIVKYKISFFKHLFLIVFYILLNFSYYFTYWMISKGKDPTQAEIKRFEGHWKY